MGLDSYKSYFALRAKPKVMVAIYHTARAATFVRSQ